MPTPGVRLRESLPAAHVDVASMTAEKSLARITGKIRGCILSCWSWLELKCERILLAWGGQPLV